MKKITLFLVVLLVSMTTFATTLYLTPNANWKSDNARFAAYFFGNGEKWVSMTEVIGATGIYEVDVPVNFSNVIFCRMSPSTTANNWENKWNQTEDLKVPTGATNHYIVKDGTWDNGGGTWATYIPPIVTIPIVKFNNSTTSFFVGDKFIPVVESQNVDNPTYTYRVNGSVVEIANDGYFFDKVGKYVFEVDVKSNNAGDVLATAKYEVTVTCKITDGTVLYMTPSEDWKKDGARFAAYFFGIDGELWADMTDADKDGVYEVTCTGTRSNVIFVRMKGATTENNWDNKLEQTGDLSYDCENNHYVIETKTWLFKNDVVLSEIDVVYTVNPENNSIVTELREIILEFTEYEEITVVKPDVTAGFNILAVSLVDDLTGEVKPTGFHMMFMVDTIYANCLRLFVDPTFAGGMESFVAEGDYVITIPAGKITFSDGINKKITLNYTIKESLPMEVEFENIAAIYEMGMWDMAYYESYSNYEVKAILKSQPTVVDKVVSADRMGGASNNYYLNDGTGVIVLQAPASGEDWMGNPVEGLDLTIGKKLPADFTATIDFKCLVDDELYLPTGEVYGAPVMSFVSKVIGVDEEGWEIEESYSDFVARCEASDFVEKAVVANINDVLAKRIDYAGQLLTLNVEANYYAGVDPYMGGMSAYMYWDAEEAFDVETTEEDSITYVFVFPKTTEDGNNYVGKLLNVQGEDLLEAAFDANATINVVTARFDWNVIAQGQTLLVKDYAVEIPSENPVDVENGALVVNIYSNNGSVCVETEAGAMIEVYTVNGLRVYAGVSNTNTTVINGLNTNIAIIRVNGEAYKVFVK